MQATPPRDDRLGWIRWLDEPCAVLRRDLTLGCANEAFERLAERTAAGDEARGSDAVHALVVRLRDALGGQTLAADGAVHLPAPGLPDWRLEARWITSGDGESFVLARLRDCARTQSLETALAKSESFNRALLSGAVDAIVIIDPRGRILSINPAAEELLGYAAAEVLGENVRVLMPSPYREEHDSYLARYLATGERRVIGIGRDVVGRRKDGSTFPMELSVFEIADPDERLFVGTMRDLTPHKRTEERLQQAVDDAIVTRAQIEIQAIELELKAEALSRAHDRAEQANLVKSQFLANMSHEIRTPLTAILGFTDILLASLTNDTEVESALIVKKNAVHLLTVINDILDLSKIEAGKLEVERRACSPFQIVEDVLGLMQVRADEKRIALRSEYAGELPSQITTDPTRLRQILLNLVGNAIKFTSTGEVRVRMSLLPSGVEDRLRAEIHDTGIGIAAEQLAQLFQPFHQADISTTRLFGGTGLGLAICKRLAELLGGEIEVRSQLGQGSTFTLTIPVAPIEGPMIGAAPRPVAKAAPAAAPTRDLTGLRVLLAEDAPDNQRLIRHVLAKAGAEVTLATNGQEAFDAALSAQLDERPFDVVLMDIQMPVLDGHEATRRLRAAGYRRPIIALTAHAMQSDRQQCLAAGCDDYATKPIERLRLLNQIGDVVGRRGALAPRAEPIGDPT